VAIIAATGVGHLLKKDVQAVAGIPQLNYLDTREKVSEAEWETRVDLAAFYRLVARYGMTDLIYNHITARVPGRNHEILINPYGLFYDEITASSLVKIDLDGTSCINPIPNTPSTWPTMSSTAPSMRRDMTSPALRTRTPNRAGCELLQMMRTSEKGAAASHRNSPWAYPRVFRRRRIWREMRAGRMQGAAGGYDH
jgi:hypothetical protein